MRTLIPAAEVAGTAANVAAMAAAAEKAQAADTSIDRDKHYDADSVFAKLKTVKIDKDEE